MTFWLRRRGYYWCGPVHRGYTNNPRYAYRCTDRAEADRWAEELDAVVEEAS